MCLLKMSLLNFFHISWMNVCKCGHYASSQINAKYIMEYKVVHFGHVLISTELICLSTMYNIKTNLLPSAPVTLTLTTDWPPSWFGDRWDMVCIYLYVWFPQDVRCCFWQRKQYVISSMSASWLLSLFSRWLMNFNIFA